MATAAQKQPTNRQVSMEQIALHAVLTWRICHGAAFPVDGQHVAKRGLMSCAVPAPDCGPFLISITPRP
jgi:hypothetical protein